MEPTRNQERPFEFQLSAVVDAVRLLWPDPGTWVAGVILVGLCLSIPNWVYPVAMGRHQIGNTHVYVAPIAAELAPNLMLGLIMSIPMGILVVGMQRIALRRLRGERGTLEHLFLINRMQLMIGGWSLLFTALQDLLLTPSFWLSRHYLELSGSQNYWALYLSWCIISSVVVIVITVPVLLVPLLIVEKKLSILDAIKASWTTLKGRLPKVLVALICAQIIEVSGIVACGVGLLVTLAVSFTFPAVVYRQLVDGSVPETIIPELNLG